MKKSALMLDIDFYQRGLLITLLDSAEHVLKVYSTKRKGKRDKQYVALLESSLNLYKGVNRTKTGTEVVLLFYDVMERGWNISHLKYKQERSKEYQKAVKELKEEVKTFKQKLLIHRH